MHPYGNKLPAASDMSRVADLLDDVERIKDDPVLMSLREQLQKHGGLTIKQWHRAVDYISEQWRRVNREADDEK